MQHKAYGNEKGKKIPKKAHTSMANAKEANISQHLVKKFRHFCGKKLHHSTDRNKFPKKKTFKLHF